MVQSGSEMVQNGPEMVQNWHEIVQNGPEIALNGPKQNKNLRQNMGINLYQRPKINPKMPK